MQISRRAVEEQVSNLRETIPVKDSSVKKLSESKRLQHPATKPPRSLPLEAILLAPDKTIGLTEVPTKLQSTEDGVNGNGHSHLLGWVDTQSKTSE